MAARQRSSSTDYLDAIGVRRLPAVTTPFDPGYDPALVEGHLAQSAHLMASIKISMACWMIADERATRRKVAAARQHNVPAVTGGGPFEVAAAQRALPAYLDLCADIGMSRVECAEGFTTLALKPSDAVREATSRGLEVEYELGEKHTGAIEAGGLDQLLDRGREWLEAGARVIVVEARESAENVGLFGPGGELERGMAERVVDAFGFDRVTFEAPNKPSQFALIEHFGSEVRLGNVRLEELLRVEIYRRGLHCDAFQNPGLRPGAPG